MLGEGMFKVAHPCLEWFDQTIIRITNFKRYEKHESSRVVKVGFNNADKLEICLLFFFFFFFNTEGYFIGSTIKVEVGGGGGGALTYVALRPSRASLDSLTSKSPVVSGSSTRRGKHDGS